MFLDFINSNKKLLRDEGNKKHFCCFFLPINVKRKSIYLVHHKKAQDWLPPGGHIDMGEKPIDTIYREFIEELNYKLTKQKILLFDLTVKDVSKSRNDCTIHYDLWYLVYLDENVDFVFDKREFYDAGWFQIEEGIKKMKLKKYAAVIKKLKSSL